MAGEHIDIMLPEEPRSRLKRDECQEISVTNWMPATLHKVTLPVVPSLDRRHIEKIAKLAEEKQHLQDLFRSNVVWLVLKYNERARRLQRLSGSFENFDLVTFHVRLDEIRPRQSE